MKKNLFTLAAILCCVMTMTLLTSCEIEKDEFSYTIIVEPGGIASGVESGNWRNHVMSVYQTALGTHSKDFNRRGSQEECDSKVLEDCKKAEMSITVAGSGEIAVHNNTVNKTVYRRFM